MVPPLFDLGNRFCALALDLPDHLRLVKMRRG